MVRLYGPAETRMRGATITMNFADPTGSMIDSWLVEQHANAAGISLRSGCHCNPGAREVALGLSQARAWSECSGTRSSSATSSSFTSSTARPPVRSAPPLGLATTFADVYRFWEFARSFRDAERATLDYIDT